MQNTIFNNPIKLLQTIKELSPNIYPFYLANRINKLERQLSDLRTEWKTSSKENRKNIEKQALEIKHQISTYKSFREVESPSQSFSENNLFRVHQVKGNSQGAID